MKKFLDISTSQKQSFIILRQKYDHFKPTSLTKRAFKTTCVLMSYYWSEFLGFALYYQVDHICITL